MPRIRTSFRHRRNMLLDLPIAGRLTLGFLVVALLATIVTGAIGLQYAQSLGKHAAFYHDLLQVNTMLNTGATYLQLMNSQLQVTLNDASAPQPSQETLNSDQKALQGLATRYDALLTDYTWHHLINQNADEASLLNEAGYSRQLQQQVVLASSALRSWQVYEAPQFRRFVLRTHRTVEQIDVIVRQEIERSETFLQALNKFAPATSTPNSRPTPSGELRATGGKDVQTELARLSFDFASEIVAHSRKLTAVTHEMRQGAISFQLDASNSSDPFTPSQPLNPMQENDGAPGMRSQIASPRGQYAPTANRETSLPGSQARNYEPEGQRSSSPQRFKPLSPKTNPST